MDTSLIQHDNSTNPLFVLRECLFEFFPAQAESKKDDEESGKLYEGNEGEAQPQSCVPSDIRQQRRELRIRNLTSGG